MKKPWSVSNRPRLVVDYSKTTATEIIDDLLHQLGEIYRFAYATRDPKLSYSVRQWAEECDMQFIVLMRRILNFDSVVSAVGQVYGINRDFILGGSRKAMIVPARHHVAWFLRTRGPRVWTTTQIGRFIGNRDHTTIMHAVEAFEGSAREEVKHEVDRRVAVHFASGEFVLQGLKASDFKSKNAHGAQAKDPLSPKAPQVPETPAQTMPKKIVMW